MKYLSIMLIAGVLFAGSVFGLHKLEQTYDAGATAQIRLGSASYPTTLDGSGTLPNPNPTDSVAVVSHSTLHSNENGAIEALEGKVGIGASTPTANTILFGNGTGSSVWSASPTLTDLVLSTLLVNGSTTLQNFTAQNFTAQNSTTSNATTTSIHLIGKFTDSSNNFGLNGQVLQSTGNGTQWANNTASGVTTILTDATSTSLTSYATTTKMTIGQKMMIWSHGVVIGNQSIGLYVKPVGSATSTALDKANEQGVGDENTDASVQGVYTAGSTANVEIYVGDLTANKNYYTAYCASYVIKGGCSIMYQILSQ